MGQRLIIEMANSHGDLLATQYMHWSAYTGCTFECARVIYEELYNMGEPKEEVEFAVALLRNAFPKAGLTPEAASALGTIETRVLDRNQGLIDVTPEEMANSQGWGEGTLHIGLNERGETTYCIDTVWKSETKDFIEEMGEEDTMKINITKDGREELLKYDSATKEWIKVPCYELSFDGWTETWDQVCELEKVFDMTERQGWAHCVHQIDDKEKEYFIMQWIG